MPKVGMEPLRRKEIIDATIAMIGERRSLDATMLDISKRAGVSSGLAHHYFGSKENILFETMRYLLRQMGERVRDAYQNAETPQARLEAIVRVNLFYDQFEPAVITAWLNFYALALSNENAARLLRIYKARLHSNLAYALLPQTGKAEAHRIATTIGALIDGIWVRHALEDETTRGNASLDAIHDYIAMELSRTNGADL